MRELSACAGLRKLVRVMRRRRLRVSGVWRSVALLVRDVLDGRLQLRRRLRRLVRLRHRRRRQAMGLALRRHRRWMRAGRGLIATWMTVRARTLW